MPNMRVISTNVADETATLVASTTAGTLVASRLQTDVKTDVWRSTSKASSTLTATWTNSVIVGCVSLAFCNLSPTATMRIRGYTNVADASPVFDTGATLASPPTPLGMFGWGAGPLGVNAFTYGGGTYGTVWCPMVSVKKIVIDIADPDNTVDYVEAGRLVIGAYWEAEKNADYGASIVSTDSSKHSRTDSGNIKTDIGHKVRVLSVALSKMGIVDRNAFWAIVRGNGKSQPLFVSLYPESADTTLTQMNEIYCKLTDDSTITTPSFNIYSGPLKMEEI